MTNFDSALIQQSDAPLSEVAKLVDGGLLRIAQQPRNN